MFRSVATCALRRSSVNFHVTTTLLRTPCTPGVLSRSMSMSEGVMHGKTVVISGASSGIGEEVAKLYASQGATLFLAARRVDKLTTVQAECTRQGAGSVTILSCDVSREEECQKFIKHVLEVTEGRGIDVLVLNAGVGQTFFLESMAADVDYHQFMNVNYYGCVYLTLAALPHLQQTAGRITVVSSLGGLVPYPRQTFYNASKFALMGFYESLRMELNAKKIPAGSERTSITMVCPGFIETELTLGAGIGKDGKPFGSNSSTGSSGESSKSSATTSTTPSMNRRHMMSASNCAQEIVTATAARQSLLITPGWYRPLYFLRKFFPSLVDRLVARLA